MLRHDVYTISWVYWLSNQDIKYETKRGTTHEKSKPNLIATSALLVSVIGTTFALVNNTIGMNQDIISLENAVEFALKATKATKATTLSVEPKIERGEEICNIELVQNKAKSVNATVNTKTGDSKAFNDCDFCRSRSNHATVQNRFNFNAQWSNHANHDYSANYFI